MYGKIGTTASASSVTGASLAYTGVNVLGYVVAASVLLFAGLALLKLVPRRES